MRLTTDMNKPVYGSQESRQWQERIDQAASKRDAEGEETNDKLDAPTHRRCKEKVRKEMRH